MANKSVTRINGYELCADLHNANSGFSKWGFAKKDRREYFIKELINPVYPMDSSAMSEALFEKKRRECREYEVRNKKLYDAVNSVSGGLLVRIIDFFRCNSRYYLVTEKISGTSLDNEQLSEIPMDKKLLLLKTTARGFYNLHSVGIIHFDVKPSNILIKLSDAGNPVARIIDFDSGFFINEDISDRELGGDLTYLAPETFLGICGEQVTIDGKADIFALGLVFHEFFCGCLPGFDTAEYQYPYEAVLDGRPLVLAADKMPERLALLIECMLDVSPEVRPTAEQILIELNLMTDSPEPLRSPDAVGSVTMNERSADTVTVKKDNWFTQAGDL